MAFPNLPRTQGLRSKSFIPPTIDGSKTIPEIVDWHLTNNPGHTIFTYHQESSGEFKTISWKEAIHAIHTAAFLLASRLEGLGVRVTDDHAPVVGIFATSDTISYILTELGLFRAGYIPFTISPRNSPAALSHLISAAKVEHLLVSGEPGIKQTANQALAMNQSLGDSSFISDVLFFSDLLRENEEQPKLYPERKFKLESHMIYIHSSGSTGFPKVVKLTHEVALQSTYASLLGAHDFCHEILGCQSLPMFHGLGLIVIVQAIVCGTTLATFEPRQPAIPMTPDGIFHSAVQTRSSYLFVVPIFLEVWARDPAKVAALAKMKGVMYGGGPLKQAVGNALTDQGVNVYITYGASETTMMAPVLPSAPGKDWEYFIINPAMQPQFVPCGEGQYELVLVNCDTHHLSVVNTKWNAVDAYSTGDILVPHPSKEGYWKIFGRVDDQIMLSTGEKTNPVPLEAILAQDPHVQDAVMFGRGRFQNGVIINPKPAHAFDPTDLEKLASFRNTIWPTVERMNEYAPQHSRLFKETIMVVTPNKPFVYTGKGSLQRQFILAEYAQEIEEMYQAIMEAAQEDIIVPTTWSEEEVTVFVRNAVHNVIKHDVSDSDDLFQHGCDSLQATWIRNTITRALKSATTAVVPNDVVYQHASITRLVHYCLDAAKNKTTTAIDTVVHDKTIEMRELVTRFTEGLPHFTAKAVDSSAYSEGDVVLLTGTTGSLGAHILETMALRPDVRKIYALNRIGRIGTTVDGRQRLALTERGIDPDFLQSDRIVLLNAELDKAGLGLDEDMLAEIRSSVTVIIHSAYRVDFNLALASFESSLASVRNLIDLALSSERARPPRIVFTSSVSVLINADPKHQVPEVIISDPSTAIGTGYSESKWVAEQILSQASFARSELVTTTVRVGQLSGGLNGCWNMNEWFPSLVQSGSILKKLPTIEESVSWIPVNAASVALADIALASSPPAVLHLAHPHPVSWTSIITTIAQALDVSLVPYDEWLLAMEESLKNTSKSQVALMRENPALRLLPFFQRSRPSGEAVPGREAMGLPRMELANAMEIAHSLKDIRRLDAEDVRRWMVYWKDVKAL